MSNNNSDKNKSGANDGEPEKNPIETPAGSVIIPIEEDVIVLSSESETEEDASARVPINRRKTCAVVYNVPLYAYSDSSSSESSGEYRPKRMRIDDRASTSRVTEPPKQIIMMSDSEPEKTEEERKEAEDDLNIKDVGVAENIIAEEKKEAEQGEVDLPINEKDIGVAENIIAEEKKEAQGEVLDDAPVTIEPESAGKIEKDPGQESEPSGPSSEGSK